MTIGAVIEVGRVNVPAVTPHLKTSPEDTLGVHSDLETGLTSFQTGIDECTTETATERAALVRPLSKDHQ